MNCLKCGKETAETQVFCEDCLRTMDNYPIKPGTPVHIPKRAPMEQEKKQLRKKELSKDDIIAQQHKLLKWLLITLGVLAIAFFVVCGILLHTLGGSPSAFGL